MDVDFTLDGGPVADRLAQMAARIPDLVAAALYAEAEIEMGEAKERTPVDTGALRASGHVERPQYASVGLGKDISVTLAFGGAAASYALEVHEDLDAFHKVGQAKFLESTVLESAPFLPGRIAARIERGL